MNAAAMSSTFLPSPQKGSGMSAKACVLAVDDDVRILRIMQRTLQMEGYRVLTARDGEAALATFSDESPDLMLLDIMMPGMDGYAVCQRTREFSQIPIIMVSARDNDDDKVQCLDVGADDYLTKPFSARELAARVRAILRRTRLWDEKPQPAIRCHDLTVDFASRRATLKGRELKLTATEYKLLSCLARNAGRVLTADYILAKVWGELYSGERHLVQLNVYRLRQKLGDNARNPQYIFTRSGMGYTMTKEA